MKRGLHYTVVRVDEEAMKSNTSATSAGSNLIQTDVPGYFCPADVTVTPTLASLQSCKSPRRGVRGQSFDTGFLNRFV